MKLKALIVGLFLAAGIFAGIYESMVLSEYSGLPSSMALRNDCYSSALKAEVPAGCPTGKSADSSSGETSDDCCSGFPDLDLAVAARQAECSIQLLEKNVYLPAKMLAWSDPSYPINKPPQNAVI